MKLMTYILLKLLHLKKRSESHSITSDCLWHHGLYSPWNSPGQNTGLGSLSILQWIFPTQKSNWNGRILCNHLASKAPNRLWGCNINFLSAFKGLQMLVLAWDWNTYWGALNHITVIGYLELMPFLLMGELNTLTLQLHNYLLIYINQSEQELCCV